MPVFAKKPSRPHEPLHARQDSRNQAKTWQRAESDTADPLKIVDDAEGMADQLGHCVFALPGVPWASPEKRPAEVISIATRVAVSYATCANQSAKFDARPRSLVLVVHNEGCCPSRSLRLCPARCPWVLAQVPFSPR